MFGRKNKFARFLFLTGLFIFFCYDFVLNILSTEKYSKAPRITSHTPQAYLGDILENYKKKKKSSR